MAISLHDIPYGVFSPEQIQMLLNGTWYGQSATPTTTTPPPSTSTGLTTWTPANFAQMQASQQQPTVQPQATQQPTVQPQGAAPAPSGGGGGLPLQNYGVGAQQTLNNGGRGFGIPGFETNPMQSTGGSWGGTTWGGAPYTGLLENPIPNSDVTNPSSPYYRGPVTNPDGTPISPGLSIKPAVPYQTTWNLQTYSGKKSPYLNIHEQMGEAMKGIQPAAPGFNWASPQALAALGGYGLPGGWTSMLGFTPGGSK